MKVPGKYYAHASSTSATCTVDAGVFLHRIDAEMVGVRIKEFSMRIGTTGYTGTEAVFYLADLLLSDVLAVNFSGGQVVHNVAVVGNSQRSCVYQYLANADGLVMVFPRSVLLSNQGKITFTVSNLTATTVATGGTNTVNAMNLNVEIFGVE